ncbi:hypothetical protein [Coleofasciculus sp. FACHB-SPT9]|uniref:hypothetical protein n=1 Tax=Cyanophyceae TaxID=3028117 RepID=UPI0018F005DF|nr:hypothetical protein [Coleofasciculus sp. FACHB-SPT9]
MIAQATLKTNRLVLRPLTFEDALSIQTFASVRELADAMISIPHPYPNVKLSDTSLSNLQSLKRVILSHL